MARKLSFKPEIKINENGDTYVMPIDAETLNGYDGYVNVDLSSAETLNDILEAIYTLEERYIFALYDLSHFISDGVSCTIIISVSEMKVIDWKNNIIYTGEYNSATSVETWFSNANATRYVEVGSGSIGQFLYIANNGAYSFKNIAISDITNLQTTLNGKLDKNNIATSSVYGVGSQGVQTMYQVGQGASAGKLVQRTDGGNINVPLTPTNDTHATSKSYVNTLIENIKRDSYRVVDIETYPTREDFLESTGEDGYLYLYPIDTTDLTKGYYRYVWENEEWLDLGTTQIDLSDYYTKTETDLLLNTKANVVEVLKSKYHLGAFDTVDTSNDDYDLITRKTGYYTFTGNETIVANGSNQYTITIDLSRPLSSNYWNTVGNVVCAGLVTANNESIYYGTKTNAIGFTDSIIIGSLCISADVYNNRQTILFGKTIEFETTRTYTEKVIKGQPINTLDVNGSEFLRDEWEKQINLLDDSYLVVPMTTNSSGLPAPATVPNRAVTNFLPIKPNTTYSIKTTNSIIIREINYADSNKNGLGLNFINDDIATFTTPSNAYYLIVLFKKGTDDTYNLTLADLIPNIMFNEGDHAYPYQEFNGHIVHAKELETTKQEIEQEIEEIVNEESIDVTDTKIIKVSGLDDNLAIPEESQVEIPKVVCGALVDNNVIPTANKNGTYTVPSDSSYYDITIYNNLGLAITEGHVILAFAKITRTISSNNFIGLCFWNNNNANIPITLTLNSNDNNGVVYNIKKIPTGSSVLKSISFNNYDGKRGFNTGDTMSYSDLNWCDLTIRYGSTIAEYLVSLSLDNALAWLRANDPNIFKYRDYGSDIVNTNGDLITTNRNVWDEKWEEGWINYNNGNNASANDALRSENYIEVISGGNVRIQSAYTGSGQVPYIYFYDTNKNYIGYDNAASSQNSKTFAIPNNCCFIRFAYPNLSTPVAYNHDICINVSDTSFNGQYVSHKQETQALPSGYGVPKLVDNKLSFDGDEIIGDKKISKYTIIDLSALTWSVSAGNRYAIVDNYGIKKMSPSVAINGICTTFIVGTYFASTDAYGIIGSFDDGSHTYLNVKDSGSNPTGYIVCELATPSETTITPIHPMSCYKGGYELQSSDVPYTLTRNYDISIKDQVKTNVEVDREQSNAIESLNQNVFALKDIIFTITNTAIDGYTNIGQITLDNDTLYIWKRN